MAKSLDVITVGRSSVDLYGQQVGGRLEDMRSFNKYIGGSPTNIACGASRLGLRVGLVTKVGNEHMGRFIREQLQREGVDLRGVKTDPARLTALAILGIRDQDQFPLIFYRENCADMGLCEDDIDADLIGDTRALVVTGTHLSHPNTEAAVLKALSLAKAADARLALDIDYRPNLWGVAGHGDGESRFVADVSVTQKLQSTLHHFDLIVGTEEEFFIAGGSTDIIAALGTVRAHTNATLVCKRGAAGATVIEATVPDDLEDAINGPGFPVEVYNVLGAGDGFMAGLLKGWMTNADWEESLAYANAGGAIAVSRHGCTPAYATELEMTQFLNRGMARSDLRNDLDLNQIHWATTRATNWTDLCIFAFDHRAQMEELPGFTPEKCDTFKQLCLEATCRVAQEEQGFGILCDDRLGRTALHKVADTDLWVGRPCELPGSHPLQLEPELGPDCGELATWPRNTVVKILCFFHPDDEPDLQLAQEETISRLYTAARRNDLEFLLEIVGSEVAPIGKVPLAALIDRFYDIGVHPDWWKLEPMASKDAWQGVCNTIHARDPLCRGIVVLGLNAPVEELKASFEVAANFELVKGFAVGRTIFGKIAKEWFMDRIPDEDAISQMAERFSQLCTIWARARATVLTDDQFAQTS